MVPLLQADEKYQQAKKDVIELAAEVRRLALHEKPKEEKEIGSEEEAVLGLATPCEHLLAVPADIEKFCEAQATVAGTA